ncbi:MAG: 3-hydroxyacyl-ACP dehydratase FabZ, partial [Granulosicoccaceae bacterium]
PFLLIDRVVDVEPGHRGRGIKNVTVNEPIFTGHFPDNPVFPGVLILEALAQASIMVGFYAEAVSDEPTQNLYLYAGIDKARFKRPVVPGDQLFLDVEVLKNRRGIWQFDAKARVGDELAASAELMIAVQGPQS